jgi:hypothetical protein
VLALLSESFFRGQCGVCHPANIATSFNGLLFFPCWLLRPSFPSRAEHVGHAANSASLFSDPVPALGLRALGSCSTPRIASPADGLRHPEQPLSPVRRSDARSAQIGSPAGISQLFQVKPNSGEPLSPILARNLLSKHRCRSALGDEVVKSGP